MRITYVISIPWFDGGTRVVAEQARQLMKRGHEVLVVSQPPTTPSLARRVKALLRGRGWLPAQRYAGSPLEVLGVPHRMLERARPVTDADVPDGDAVIATWWATAEAVAALSPAKGTKFHLIQGDEPGWYPEGSDRYTACLRSWRLPTRKLVVSRFLADAVRQRVGQRAQVVRNAVDPKLFAPGNRGRQTEPTVGLVYNREPLKGFDVVQAALAMIRRQLPQVRVRAMGKFPAPDGALPRDSTAYYVTPPLESIPEIYRGCDIWLMGSRSEGFGLPILEAVACGTPVVSTRVGAAPELLEEGGGYVVEIDDAETMAQRALEVLRLPPDQWRAMSDAAARAARLWNWDQAGARLEEILGAAVRHR